MKKLKLIAVSLIALIVLPFCVNAASKEPIKVHIFRGEGCGYCAAALEFFESIEDEYGKYFDLVEHEVWYDTDNASLMTKVADHFGEEVSGVPYIIIGEKTFQGYAESYNEEIKEEIVSLYESGNFVDVVEQVKSGNVTTKEENKDNATIIIIAVAIIGFVALFYFARDPKETPVKEEKEQVTIKEEKKEEVKKTTSTKKTPTKKVTTTKKSSTKKATTAKKPTTKKTTTKKTTKK